MTKFTDVRGCLVRRIDCVSVLLFKQGNLCSTSYPSGNQIDGSPLVAINFVIAFVFLTKFYIMSYWFALLTLKISYWSFILCEYQLPSSIKPWLSTAASVSKNVEKWWKILKFQKIIREVFLSRIFFVERLLMKISRRGKIKCWFYSTSSRRKPGWQFTAGST